MEETCYVCNEKTKDWRRNLVETKSKHTKTPIVTFINKLLGDYVSHRNMNDESNCICSDCLSRFYSYDWMCMKAKEQEKELQTLLVKTENSLITNHIKNEIEFVNPAEFLQSDYNQENCVYIKPDIYDEGGVDETEDMEFDQETVAKNETPDDDKEEDVDNFDDNYDDNDDDDYDDDDDDDDDYDFPKASSSKKIPLKKKTPAAAKKVAALTKVATPQNGTAPKKATGSSKMCETCGEKLSHVKTVQLHEKIHSKSPGMITCHICMYEMKDKEKDAFKDHVRKHTKAPPKHCVICNEGGTENFDLKHHVQNQHNATLSCKVCGKSFVYASVLSLHLRSHIDHLPEECDHCKKRFPDKETLEIHKKTHVKAMCTICGQKFTTQRKCKRHELRHTNQAKQFKCSLCPGALDTERGLKLHMIRKHADELNDKE